MIDIYCFSPDSATVLLPSSPKNVFLNLKTGLNFLSLSGGIYARHQFNIEVKKLEIRGITHFHHVQKKSDVFIRICKLLSNRIKLKNWLWHAAYNFHHPKIFNNCNSYVSITSSHQKWDRFLFKDQPTYRFWQNTSKIVFFHQFPKICIKSTSKF